MKILSKDELMTKVIDNEDLALIYVCNKPIKNSAVAISGKNILLRPVTKVNLSDLTDDNSAFIDFSEEE